MVPFPLFIVSIFSNSCCANPEPLFLCSMLLVWTDQTLPVKKITATTWSCVMNGLQHHSCALWRRHGVQSFFLDGDENYKPKEVFLKTQQDLVGEHYWNRFVILWSFQNHIQSSKHLYCSGDVSVFKKSTTSRCQWLADRHFG